MPHYLDYTTVDEAAAKTDVPIWRDGAFAGEFGVRRLRDQCYMSALKLRLHDTSTTPHSRTHRARHRRGVVAATTLSAAELPPPMRTPISPPPLPPLTLPLPHPWLPRLPFSPFSLPSLLLALP